MALAVTKLASMVFDLDREDSSGWKSLHLVRLRLGERIENWPKRVAHLLQVSIVLEFCHLWRKIIHFSRLLPLEARACF